MKKWRLTHKWLEGKDACFEQREAFRAAYPRGLWLYAEQAKTERAVWHADGVCTFAWCWFLDHLPGNVQRHFGWNTYHPGQWAAAISLAVSRMK